MPMPQRGPRGSPVTEVRQDWPAAISAAAIVLGVVGGIAAGQVGRGRNWRDGGGEGGGDQGAGGERGGDAEAFVAGGEEDGRIAGSGADEGQAVGGGGAEAGPGADGGEAGEGGHVLLGASEHSAQHGMIYLGVSRVELAGRADEDLAGGAGLGVEGDRVAVGGVGALEVAELDQLVAEPAGIAVGDEQVALARADGQAGG